MNGYNLTDDQKELLRRVVKCDEEGRLFEKGFLRFLRGDDKYTLRGCNIVLESLSDLDALCDEGLLSKEQGKPDPVYRITNAGRRVVESDFEVPIAQVAPQVSIGAIIQTMSGGNVQAVGVAQGIEISQVVNDPDLLRSQVEALTENLLNEVKSALKAEDLSEYLQSIRDLKEQLLAEEPSPSLIKRLVRTLGLLGDIDGTVDLMTRVWPFLQALLLIVAARIQ